MKKQLLAISAFFLISATAQAGILIEPYMNYQLSGGLDRENTSTQPDNTGSGFGARLGMTFIGGFWLAADYESSSGETEYVAPTVTPDRAVDYDATTLYATVGFSFPILLRVWAGYALSGKYEQEGDGTNNVVRADLKGVSGYKLGVSYAFLPFIHLFGEMRSLTYKEDNDTALVDRNTAFTSTVVGVTVPLSF